MRWTRNKEKFILFYFLVLFSVFFFLFKKSVWNETRRGHQREISNYWPQLPSYKNLHTYSMYIISYEIISFWLQHVQLEWVFDINDTRFQLHQDEMKISTSLEFQFYSFSLSQQKQWQQYVYPITFWIYLCIIVCSNVTWK